MKKIALLLILVLIAPAILFSASTDTQYLMQAKKLFELGKYKDAIVLYDTVLEINNKSASAYLGKGNCYVLLKKEKTATRNYNRAQSFDKTIKIPDLTKWIELEKNRGKNVDKIRAKYWELFGKKDMAKAIDSVPADTDATELADTKSDIKKAQEIKEVWSTGGKGKMTALGGITLAYPGLSTAVDSVAHDMKVGLLFRKSKHFFSLQPLYAKYRDITRYAGGGEGFYETQVVSVNESLGEVGWPSTEFLNSIRPLYHNSYGLETTGLGTKDSNTGNLFGGTYIAGFKPIPLFGMAGSITFTYAPYAESENTAGTSAQNTVNGTELAWDASAGLFLPFIITQNDELDLTCQFGTYSPEPDFLELDNNNLLGMPHSMIYQYTKAVAQTESILDSELSTNPLFADAWTIINGLSLLESDTITRDNSIVYETTGYVLQANMHYMIGNGQHEVFAYFEAPMSIEHKAKETEEYFYKAGGIRLPIDSLKTEGKSILLGNERGFSLDAGFRSNFVYVTPSFKYSQAVKESYFHVDDPDVNGIRDALAIQGSKQVSRTQSMVIGLNITPIEQISLPLEYQWMWTVVEGAGKVDAVKSSIRGGLEIKPSPKLALRGGMGYELARMDGTLIPSSGTEANPYTHMFLYSFGGGFNLPTFEFNVGCQYRQWYQTNRSSAISDDINDLMYMYVDFNVYM